MTENFIYSTNAVAPLIIISALGFILKKIGFLSEEFFRGTDKLVFKVVLPAYIFKEVAGSVISETFNLKLVIFCVAGIIAVFIALSLFVPIFIKNKRTRGAFIQGVYRSNFAILGLPIAENLYGGQGVKIAALILPFVIPLFNVLAVIILSINAGDEDGEVKKADFKKIFLDILKNPLIIAVAAGLVFMNIDLPEFASKSINNLANVSTPLALLSLGANFRFEGIRDKLKYAVSAVTLRMVILPAIFTAAAILLGFCEAELVVVFVLFGAPTAVSGYIMAKNMNSDYELAGQHIVLTTVISAFTVFLGSFILRTFGFI